MREHQKVTAAHLTRNAYLYVRQSTLRQVLENRESTQRQYALRDRAIALGWPADQVVVIDCDLGQSGASAADREGFQKLVSEVGMGKAGIVLGLEVSRLARNSSNWHRLLEICALSDTLILDEDGLYDPSHFNDRLLLGLKGTMSEAELHVLHARLHGGRINKAQRGELKNRLPVGLAYDSRDRVVLDPDKQVQGILHQVFTTFRRLRSACATAKAMRQDGIHLPCRITTGPGKGELEWREAANDTVLRILHNPRYAGAFFFGSQRETRRADGSTRRVRLPQEEWPILLPDVHEGYISWEEYQDNQRCLRENTRATDVCRWPHPPREGPALLQGIAICGSCGSRMSPRYVRHSPGICVPYYTCSKVAAHYGGRHCQCVPGKGVDEAIGQLLLEALTPLTLDTALAVQQELQSQLEATDRLRRLHVERASYEVDLARRRFMQVDPDNRLVADALEADWNARLRDMKDAQDEYERRRENDRRALTAEQEEAIRNLASDFPRLWKQPTTPHQERKRIVRLLLEDVTLIKTDRITLHVRFRGGATQTLNLPIPPNAWQMRKTSPEVVRVIDELLDEHPEGEIAGLLNERGLPSGRGKLFTADMVQQVREAYGLKPRRQRLRERGLKTTDEIAQRFGVRPGLVIERRMLGLLTAHRLNDKGEYLYEEPTTMALEPRRPKTNPEVIQAIDELLDEHTEKEIAMILNERGLCSAEGRAFNSSMVHDLRRSHEITSRFERLRKKGLLTVNEVAGMLGITTDGVIARRNRGRLKGHRINDKGECLFEMTAHNPSREE